MPAYLAPILEKLGGMADFAPWVILGVVVIAALHIAQKWHSQSRIISVFEKLPAEAQANILLSGKFAILPDNDDAAEKPMKALRKQ